jgi:D-glycero-D-manno-heptose 1,7-bisphosphate phosphatase
MTSEPPERPNVPVLYLDLDGTVRRGLDDLGRFVNGPEDVFVYDEVPHILQRFKNEGWRIIGITNQGGVSLGYLTTDTLLKTFAETIRQCDGHFDNIAWCPHHPDAETIESAVCWCRKPKPGLIVETTMRVSAKNNERHPVHMSWMIGDRFEDQGCAYNAGLNFMWADAWRDGGWKDILKDKAVAVSDPVPLCPFCRGVLKFDAVESKPLVFQCPKCHRAGVIHDASAE